MTEIKTYNAAVVRVTREGPMSAPITMTVSKATTNLGACRAFMTIDEASMLAAALANAVDAAKRG